MNVSALIFLFLLQFMLSKRVSQNETSLIILGSGSPRIESDRMGPGFAVKYKNHTYIVDAGSGIVRRTDKANINIQSLNKVFITHLHSDHTVGLPDILLSPANFNRSNLAVYGPPGIKRMMDKITEAYQEDIEIRIKYQPNTKPEYYNADVIEIYNNYTYQDDIMKVTAFEEKHGKWKYALGYRFDTIDGKVIVFSGDTAPNENLINMSKGCDILVHEVYSVEDFLAEGNHWNEYYKIYHTNAWDLGILAQKIEPKKLVLVHHPPDIENIVREIRENYHGELIVANDLDIIH